MKIYSSLKIIFTPVLIGSLLGSIPFFFAIILIKQLYDSTFFNLTTIFHHYDREELDDGQIERAMSGRLGLMLVIMGGILIHYGASLIIPVPSREQERLI